MFEDDIICVEQTQQERTTTNEQVTPITNEQRSSSILWVDMLALSHISSIGRTTISSFLGRNFIKVGRNKLTPMRS